MAMATIAVRPNPAVNTDARRRGFARAGSLATLPRLGAPQDAPRPPQPRLKGRAHPCFWSRATGDSRLGRTVCGWRMMECFYRHPFRCAGRSRTPGRRRGARRQSSELSALAACAVPHRAGPTRTEMPAFSLSVSRNGGSLLLPSARVSRESVDPMRLPAGRRQLRLAAFPTWRDDYWRAACQLPANTPTGGVSPAPAAGHFPLGAMARTAARFETPSLGFSQRLSRCCG
jgi:hypothetical protein